MTVHEQSPQRKAANPEKKERSNAPGNPMKTLFISLGGSTDAAYESLCREYWKRMPGSQVLDLKPEPLPSDPKPAEISRALDKEAERILAAIPRQYFLVALCVEGKPLSSEQFADALARAEQNGHPGAAFVVGSSYGLSDRVKSAAHLKLSLSALTLPHKLARLVLAEAVYRAFEIGKGSRYHK